jgi:hypothetical protein
VFAPKAERAHAEAYFEYVPMLAAPCIVLILLALVTRALEARRGLSAARPAAWPFFVAPPAIFTLQEHLERLGQNVVWHDRAFLAGLVLQVLLGLAAWLVARLLLGVATVVGRALRPRLSRRPLSAVRGAVTISIERLPLLATGHAQRGPPALSFR